MAKEDKVKSPKSKKTKESKTKETKTKDAEAEVVPYEVRMKAVTVISKPMADEKKTKKFYKLVKKAAKEKICRRGVKEVCKGIRQGRKGICIIAGDISPIDVISHMAFYCEEQGVNYIYVPSKVDLGAAAKTKRPTSCVLITPPRETKDKPWDPTTKEFFAELKEVCIQEMAQVPT
ncbi:unnamed protein product [Hapterophycus canaliculatus]